MSNFGNFFNSIFQNSLFFNLKIPAQCRKFRQFQFLLEKCLERTIFSIRPRIAKILFQKPVWSEQFRLNPCPIFGVGKNRFSKMISKGKIKYTSIRGFEYRVYRFKRVESVTRSVTSRCHADWFRFECAKSWSPSRGEIFLSLHERAERETKILKNLDTSQNESLFNVRLSRSDWNRSLWWNYDSNLNSMILTPRLKDVY